MDGLRKCYLSSSVVFSLCTRLYLADTCREAEKPQEKPEGETPSSKEDKEQKAGLCLKGKYIPTFTHMKNNFEWMIIR